MLALSMVCIVHHHHQNKVEFCLRTYHTSSDSERVRNSIAFITINFTPTVSQDSLQNSRLHTGARMNVVLLTYLLLVLYTGH